MTLTIPESLLLLSRKNETGAKQGDFVEFALAGGAIGELMLRGQVEQVPGKPNRMQLAHTGATGDRFLDACLDAISKKGSGRPIGRYVTSLAGKSKLLREQANSLVDKGILQETGKSFLVFSWKNYPEKDGRAETDLVAHLSDVMFGEKVPTDADRVIVALAEKTGLLKRNFDKAPLRAHKARIKEIVEGGIAPASATIKAINSMIAALIAASAAGAAASATG